MLPSNGWWTSPPPLRLLIPGASKEQLRFHPKSSPTSPHPNEGRGSRMLILLQNCEFLCASTSLRSLTLSGCRMTLPKAGERLPATCASCHSRLGRISRRDIHVSFQAKSDHPSVSCTVALFTSLLWANQFQSDVDCASGRRRAGTPATGSSLFRIPE